MILSDEQVRHLAVTMLTAETERDQQRVIGASDLSNPCDHCLALRLLGKERTSEFADRPYLGRVVGTAIHSLLEERLPIARTLYGEAQAEQKVIVAHIDGYGDIPGHFDMLPTPDHLIDWKSTERKKLFPLIDYIYEQRGEEAPYGRTHADVKLSEAKYAEKMAEMAFKVQGYYGQANAYMRGAGQQCKRASLVFVSRSGTGYNDNPAYSNYENPRAVHDIWVLSFDRDDAYMDALEKRGNQIWAHLQAGGSPADFEGAEHCFICRGERDKPAELPAMEFTLEAA